MLIGIILKRAVAGLKIAHLRIIDSANEFLTRAAASRVVPGLYRRETRIYGHFCGYALLLPVLTAITFCGCVSVALAQEQAEIQATAESAATPSAFNDNGLIAGAGKVLFPALSRDSIDRLFDSLRASSGFVPQPLRESQIVDPHTAGIWAGTKTFVDSKIGEIVLRFRPTAEARLARANGQGGTLAEWFDVKLSVTPQRLIFAHSLAVDKFARRGLEAKFVEVKRDRSVTEYIEAGREAGLYIAVPAPIRAEVEKAWGVMICPRTYTITPVKNSTETRLELSRSPYELVEVKFPLSANVQARMSSATKLERLSIKLALSSGLPSTQDSEEEVTSLLPIAQLAYRPTSDFDFIKLPIQERGLREGYLTTVSMTTMMGHRRQQHHSHVLYVERIDEPSPVSVIVRAHRPARDEGTCYVVAEQRSMWNRYDKVAPPSELKN
jgi:hypothetical protein